MNELTKNVSRFVAEYDDIYLKFAEKNATKDTYNGRYDADFKGMRDLILHVIPSDLKKSINLRDPYQISAKYGQGNFSKIPWIAILDSRITESAKSGVYIVYLLNKSKKELYLSFELATTEALRGNGEMNSEIIAKPSLSIKPSIVNALKEIAEGIREKLNDSYFLSDNNIDSGYEGYDAGTIYYKKYTLADLSDEELFISDLKRMMGLYEKYYKEVYAKGTSENNSEMIEEKGDEEMTVKDTVKHIADYISSKGFSYEGNLVENFYLSLKSKPFVILAGTSGTGKTRLVKLFAEAIGAEYKLVPVRPDWSDSTDLFGHLDLNGKFVPGAIIDFLKAAQEDAEHPYILCLDEMNLARVEYYLSDFLSVIETREHVGSRIVSDPLISKDKYGTDAEALEKYGELIFPDNLYIVGTVNMDETTFPFSKKVLDRANTIEFSYVNLKSVPTTAEDVEALTVNNDFLHTDYLFLSDCKMDYSALCDQLQTINEILQAANAHIGYRIRDEIVFYMLNNRNADHLISDEEAFDNAIMQKILPRIQGSSTSVKDMLCDLFAYCAEGSVNKDFTDSDKMKQYLDGGNPCHFRKSAEKIAMMVRRFEEDGFTAYWL